MTSPALSGGQNGVGSPKSDPQAVLAAMIAQREPAAAPAIESSPTSTAPVDPENPSSPTELDNPGQNDLPSETPAAPGDEALDETSGAGEAGEGSPENVPSENHELIEALNGLSASERKAALDLVKQLNGGEIPRIAKLVAQKYQSEAQIEAMATELEALRAATAAGAANGEASRNGAASFPEGIAKLKTADEVRSRMDAVQGDYDALTDYLDENPGESSTVYQVGDQQFTRQQLIQRRAARREELKQLPKRLEQIQQHAAAAQQQAQFVQMQGKIKQGLLNKVQPLANPEHPYAKAVQTRLKDAPFLKQFASPEYAALVWELGEKAVNAEFPGLVQGAPPSNGLKRPAVPANGVKPAPGRIPLGKPHSAGGGATAPRVDGRTTINSALNRLQKERSSAAAAEFIGVTGR